MQGFFSIICEVNEFSDLNISENQIVIKLLTKSIYL